MLRLAHGWTWIITTWTVLPLSEYLPPRVGAHLAETVLLDPDVDADLSGFG